MGFEDNKCYLASKNSLIVINGQNQEIGTILEFFKWSDLFKNYLIAITEIRLMNS